MALLLIHGVYFFQRLSKLFFLDKTFAVCERQAEEMR